MGMEEYALVKRYPWCEWYATEDHKWSCFVSDMMIFKNKEDAAMFETEDMKKCFRKKSEIVLL